MISEKRRHKRIDIGSAVEHFLNEYIIEEESFDGVVSNMSESGVCLFTTKPLTVGQKITIKNRKFHPPKKSVVRWSEQYKGLYCRAGLEFI
jgi:hypothetical protein